MLIFKIVHAAEWEAAQRNGTYGGSSKDKADGFLHFSTAEQLPGTLAQYYANEMDLLLVAVEPYPLGAALKFESSRGGARYPHLYASLPLAAVRWTRPITRDAEGVAILDL